MAQFNPYEQYNAVTFDTADPAKLVVETYKAAIRELKEATRAVKENDYTARAKSFEMAFELVSELRKSLNMEQGGEIAKNLEALYEYFTREILLANVNSDVDRLEPIIGLLTDLKNTWEEARKQIANEG